MALTVQLQLNKLLQHRRGKREGEAPVSKHQTQLGRVRWASRRGEGEPNPPRETKNQARTGAEIGGQKFMLKISEAKCFPSTKIFKTYLR